MDEDIYQFIINRLFVWKGLHLLPLPLFFPLMEENSRFV